MFQSEMKYDFQIFFTTFFIFIGSLQYHRNNSVQYLTEHLFFYGFSEPPKSATVHVVKTTPTSLSIRWRITDDGNSPITKVILNYKMTYGEWTEQEVKIYFLN